MNAIARLWHLLATPRPGAQVWAWAFGATIAFGLVLAFLHSLPGRQKRFLIAAVTFLAGLFYFLEFMLPSGYGMPGGKGSDNFLSVAVSPMGDFLLVLGAMALGLGIINLAQVNGRILVRMQTGWQNALIFFVGFFAMAIVGIYHGNHPDNHVWSGAYDFLLTGLYVSLSSSVFALLAFFIATAAFRAFRFGSVEATLMMITAFIVMFGNIGSEVITGWISPSSPLGIFRLDSITYWIMTTVNMAAQRALLFGIAMGELAIALRIWLSLERGHFFDQEV